MPHNRKENYYIVPAWVFDEVKAYLSARPYSEVYKAMTALNMCKKTDVAATSQPEKASEEA